MTETIKAPRHTSTIDQHQGTHEATGLPIYSLVTITTDFSDYSQESWDGQSAEDQEWWAEMIADIHDARVEMANLDADAYERASAILESSDCNDVGDLAAVSRRAIAEARA